VQNCEQLVAQPNRCLNLVDALKNGSAVTQPPSPVYACRRLFEVRGGAAMMTELEFLDRFQRQPNGVWACTKPINVKGPRGPVVISQGASFSPGALFMGLGLAKELDQMAMEHGLVPKASAAA
jgi:hypothetical protein